VAIVEDTATWISKPEACKLTGLSLKTIERLVTAGKIRMAYRRVPGRRPLAVLNPVDLETLAPQPAQPVTLPVKPVDVLSMLLQASSRVSLKDKLFLTVKEASELSGLSQAFLRRQIEAGSLPALRDVALKIKCEDFGVESTWNSYGRISITVLIAARTLWKVVMPGTVGTTRICNDLHYNLP
jgi:predicted DNA-binding transcriptional regulator AlpA